MYVQQYKAPEQMIKQKKKKKAEFYMQYNFIYIICTYTLNVTLWFLWMYTHIYVKAGEKHWQNTLVCPPF